MKRQHQLLLLAGVFLILCALLVGVRVMKNKEAKVDQEPTKTLEEIIISQIPSEDLMTIVVTNKKGTLTFKPNGEGDSWKLQGYDDYKMKHYLVGNYQRMFTNLTARRLVEETTDEAKLKGYGLTDPMAKVQGALKDGSTKTLLFGKKTSEGNTYYAKLADDDKVYTVSANYGLYVNFTAADFRDDKLVAVDPTQLESFKISGLEQQIVEIVPNTDGNAYSKHIMVQPYEAPRGVDTYRFEEYLKELPQITIDDYIFDQSNDLATYGLDQPSFELKMVSLADEQGNQKIAHYLFGSSYEKEGESYLYFKQVGNPYIYGMKNDALLNKLKKDAFSLVDKLIYIVNILKVDVMKVSGPEGNYTLSMERQTTKNEDGEEEIKETFYYEGKVMEDEVFRDIYQVVIGLSGDYQVMEPGKLDETNKVSIRYDLEDGTTKEVLYYPYEKNESFYLTKIEEGVYFAVAKDDIEYMFKTLKDLKK